jgi:hypothetical protein
MNFQRWIKNAITYMGVAFFFTALPLPQWGITSTIKKAQAITGEGIWIENPERVLAMGFFYFLILSLTEFFSPMNKNMQTSKIPSQTDDDHEFLKSGIVIKSFTDGSKQYTFKMARYLSGLFFTFFIFLSFLGATILLMSGDWIENILGILVFLLIDVLLFGYLCLELFEKYYVRIEKDTVVLRGGIFGIGNRRKIKFQNLFKVQQHTSKFGERGLLSISILTKSGKKYLAARNVGPPPQANKLAEDMEETLSKLGWRIP